MYIALGEKDMARVCVSGNFGAEARMFDKILTAYLYMQYIFMC